MEGLTRNGVRDLENGFAHCGMTRDEAAGKVLREPHMIRQEGEPRRYINRSTFDTCPKCFAPPAAPCIFTAMGKVTYRTLAGAQKA